MLSPRLQLKVAQKQILTPGLVQMVTVLQLNRMELKEMINQEIVENPVLEESLEEGEEITPEELQPLLEAERSSDPADQSLLDAADIKLDGDSPEVARNTDAFAEAEAPLDGVERDSSEAVETSTTDPFDEIDFGSFFDDYLDPGYRSPAVRIGRKAVVRDLSFAAANAAGLPPFATERGAAGRRHAGCGGIDHRQSG